MAVYAELFDGTRLEFPDGTDPSVIAATAKRVTQEISSGAAKPPPPQEAVVGARKPEDVGFLERNIGAAKRGVEQLGDITGGLGLAATSLTGTEAETAAKMRDIKREQAVPQETPGYTAADIERIYKKEGLLSAAGAVPSYITEQILQSAPQMAVPLAAGAGAAAISGPFAPIVGPLVGIGTYGIQQFGNFLTRQAVEKNDPKELELTKAAMAAGATAPLGYFADRFTAGLGGLGPKKAGEEVLKELSARQVAAKVGKRAAVGASAGVIAEAPLEVLEQAAERWQAGLELTGDDAANEYKEAFFGAAAAGAGIGGASRAIQAYQTPVKPTDKTPTEDTTAPPATTVDPNAPRAAPPSSAQDTQAMIDEISGLPPVAPPADTIPPAAPPADIVPPSETVPPITPSMPPVAETAPVIPEPPVEARVIPELTTQELPVSDLKLSKDVPQFKSGASEQGVVEPLTGKFDRTGVAPIQVWERANGDLEVISGRHRLDLAKRTGEKTIPAQIHREVEGFDAIRAASLDALLNIREGQGKVKDYVQYFQAPGYTREEAESSGVLARATGQRAYAIATNGSQDLIASHRADQLTDEAATKIANTAPREDALQALGIKMIQDGKSITNTVNTMQAVKAMSSERGETTLDMFGFDDSAMKEAQEMAKIAARKQSEISNDLAAVTGAAKRPETAKKYGINVNNPAEILAKTEQLRQQRAAWDNWSSSPELIGEIRAEMRPTVELEPTTPSQLQAQEEAVKAAQAKEETAAAQAEKQTRTEREKKEIAQQSERVSDTFELGQTPDESLSGQKRLDDDILFSRSKVGSSEEIDTAEKVAQLYRNDGRESNVVYQKGDIALIQTRMKNGDVIYMPIKGERHSTSYVDISSDQGSQLMTALKLTQPQKDELLKAREEIEFAETEKHKISPFLTIKSGVTGSPGIPKEFVNLAKDFVKMLGITGDIYMISKEEAVANKDKFTGPHRPIGFMGQKVEFGSVRQLNDGNYVMVVSPSTSKVRTIETIAHELGHVHELQVFNNANPEVRKAIIKDFNKWFDSQKNMSVKELVDTLRPKVTARQTEMVNPTGKATDLEAYWRNFPEWYADQVARWATTSDKPLTVVEKFFKRLADALKKFYKTLKGQKYLPAQSMKEFLDNIAAQSDFESIKKTFDKGQMALFSKSKVESTKDDKPAATARNYLGKPVEASWAFPEDRFIKVPGAPEQSIDKLLYIFQDKQIDLKRAQEGIAKAAGEITDNINAYDKEQLFHGKVATGIRNFLLNELMPAIKKIKEFKLTTKDMQDYLLARHAEERNNRMNELNKLDPRTGKPRKTPWELQDRASGMSTDKAREYLKNLDPAKKQSLETIGNMFDKMITGTQQILVDSGAESQATIDAWNEAYKHYMPLFRVEEDFNNGENRSGLSKGFSVSSPFSKRAMGSAKEVQNIVNNLIKQRERALIRAEKMPVIKALYGLFLMNPNPDIALPVNPDAIKDKGALIAELEGLGYKNAAEIANNLMEEPKTRYISKGKRVIDKATGLPTSDTEESVKLRIDNNARFGDNVLSFRVDGKNRYLFFRQDNPNAVRMAASLNSLDVESLGTVMSIVAKGTRWFANVNTQYNPIFAAVNLIRDIGSAQFNLTTTPLAGKQAQVTAGIFPAMRGIFKVLRAERGGEVGGDSAMEKAFREFREAGGQTGYRDAIARKESDRSIIDDMLKQKSLSGNALKAMKSVFNALSDFNDTLENSIRLSAYIQASKPKSEGGLGLSKQQAAVIAKNLTVNFDKKGQISANVNALYAFFNASVQGTARLATTLTGPKGKAIIGGGILAGSMQAILLAAAGFREDEPPEFVKQRNFVIPTPDGNYLTIPYPLGFNLLPNIGRITTEFMISGGKNPAKRAGDLLGSVADAFSPIGSSGLSMQTIAPTVLDPLAALEANKDAFGRPIYKEDRATNPTPGYLRSRENASEMSKAISYFFNLASGGTKYSKGFVSPTGDEIDYVIGQVTGGLGREIMKTGQTIKAAGTGEDLPAYRVPLLGRFYGETESNAAESQRFYNNITRMADHENEIKGRIKNKESVASYYRDNPQARLYQQANTIENQINALNKQKKEFIERDLPKDRIKRIENQKALIMKRFNDQLAKFEE
jgi:hypothetical protein